MAKTRTVVTQDTYSVRLTPASTTRMSGHFRCTSFQRGEPHAHRKNHSWHGDGPVPDARSARRRLEGEGTGARKSIVSEGSEGKPPSPKTTKTTAKVTKTPKVTTAAKGSSTPKTKTTTTSQTKLAKAETGSAKKSGTARRRPRARRPRRRRPTTIDFTKGKVGEKLTKNTKLAEKLGTQLTALGYTGDVFEAAYGFKNFGQFNAAVNNAQNHEPLVRTAEDADDRSVGGCGRRRPLRESEPRWHRDDGASRTAHESGADDEPRTGEEDHRDLGCRTPTTTTTTTVIALMESRLAAVMAGALVALAIAVPSYAQGKSGGKKPGKGPTRPPSSGTVSPQPTGAAASRSWRRRRRSRGWTTRA